MEPAFVRVEDWKLIEWYEDHRRELYNLHDDPGEQHDLAATNPEKVRDLAARLDAWRADVKPAMPGPNPGETGVTESKSPTVKRGQ